MRAVDIVPIRAQEVGRKGAGVKGEEEEERMDVAQLFEAYRKKRRRKKKMETETEAIGDQGKGQATIMT